MGSGILTGNSGNILTPTYMSELCEKGDSLMRSEYRCYYQISFNENRNISIEFSKFKLNFGSITDCSTAQQIMVLMPGTKSEAGYGCLNFIAYRYRLEIYQMLQF